MTSEALAPLLRGVGSSLLLAGALIGYVVAHQNAHGARPHGQSQDGAGLSGKGSSEVTVGSQSGPGGMSDESVAEQVVENPWFELLGFVGAAAVSSSFYVEYLARRKRSA